jgi:hypothetical protein
MGKQSNWFNQLAGFLRQRREAKRDIIVFALMLGYNSIAGGVQICDRLAQRQFWKPQNTDLIHDFPLARSTARYMTALRLGAQTELTLPNQQKIILGHAAHETLVDGQMRLIETITVQGLYAQDFTYRRAYTADGRVEIEARLGAKFRQLSLPAGTAQPLYVQQLRALAAQKKLAVPQAA